MFKLYKNFNYLFLSLSLVAFQTNAKVPTSNSINTQIDQLVENTKNLTLESKNTVVNSEAITRISSTTEQTLNLLTEVENVIPDLIENVAQNKKTGLDLGVITQFMNIYNKKITLLDLLQLRPLTQNGADKRLLPFAIFVLIKSAETLSTSYIKGQIKKNPEIQATAIDDMDKIINKCESIINLLMAETRNQLGIQVPSNATIKGCQPNSIQTILKDLNTEKLFQNSNIAQEELENFYISVEVFGGQILRKAEIDTLKKITTGQLLKKMKQETTFDKFKDVMNLLISKASQKAQDAIDEIISFLNLEVIEE